MLNIKGILRDQDIIRVIAVDPGSKRCGISVLELDLNTGLIAVRYCQTARGNTNKTRYAGLVGLHPERLCRNMVIGGVFTGILNQYSPTFIACEKPYSGRVQAFEALTENVTLLKAAAWAYDNGISFEMINAGTAKKRMNVNGNSGDKQLMHDALLRESGIIFCATINPLELDEHEVDSCCVGIHILRDIWETINRSILDKG